MVGLLKKLKCPHCGKEFFDLKGGFVLDTSILTTCPSCGKKFLPIGRKNKLSESNHKEQEIEAGNR